MDLKKKSALIITLLMLSILLQSMMFLENSEGSEAIADSPWPKYRGDLRNTGRSPYDTSHVDGDLKWRANVYGDIVSEPVIGPDGTIYVCSGAFSLRSPPARLNAINPNGTVKWIFERGNFSYSTPAVANDGTIYLGVNELTYESGSVSSRKGTFYSVNPDGTEKWNYSVENTIYSSPTIDENGIIYMGLGDKLYAFEEDGSVKWNFTTQNRLYNLPAIGDDGLIYFTSGADLYAINTDGTDEWVFRGEDERLRSPAIGDDGTIFVPSTNGNLYAIDPKGIELWRYHTNGTRVASLPAIGVDGSIYFSSENLYAVNPDGSEKWVFEFADDSVRYYSPVLGADGTIYIGTRHNRVFAIDPEGNRIWTEKFRVWGGDFHASIGEDGTLYVAYGSLIAIGEKYKPSLAEVVTGFLSDNVDFIFLFTVVGIAISVKIKKSRENTSTTSKEIFLDDYLMRGLHVFIFSFTLLLVYFSIISPPFLILWMGFFLVLTLSCKPENHSKGIERYVKRMKAVDKDESITVLDLINKRFVPKLLLRKGAGYTTKLIFGSTMLTYFFIFIVFYYSIGRFNSNTALDMACNFLGFTIIIFTIYLSWLTYVKIRNLYSICLDNYKQPYTEDYFK